MIHARYIQNKNLSPARGLAIDEALCGFVAKGEAPPSLHLYNYVPSVIIGRYQNASASLRLDRCEDLGIRVNRRISGGGTVFMTPDQLAFALVLPTGFPGLPSGIHGSFQFLVAALARALRSFHLEAEFMGKNDLTVNGKKIAGLAISQDHEGVTFFHASLLIDFDLETMLEILNLPTKRMLDRGISCFGNRMTTMNAETGKKLSLEEVREAVHRAVSGELDLDLPLEDLSPGEEEIVSRLSRERYENDEWIYGMRTPKRRMGFAEAKTPAGLIQVHLALSGGAIETLMITGDYFSRTRDIVKLESILKWTSFRREAVLQRLEESGADRFIHRLDLPPLLELIKQAANERKTIA